MLGIDQENKFYELCETPIQATYNYSKFKLKDLNREINDYHVEKLKKAIVERNLLHVYPITVSTDFFVLDGQHRLKAAQSLKYPIFFRIIPNSQWSDIITANVNVRKWTLQDYLNFYVNQQKPSYLRLQEVLGSHPAITLPIALRVLSGRKDALESFKKGELELDENSELWKLLENVEKTLNILKIKMMKDRSILRTQAFMIALALFLKKKDVHVERFQQKITNFLEKLHPCTHASHYIELFTRIYNYGTKNDKRIKNG